MLKKIEIYPFMTGELGLSGNELVLFAIMWRDSEKGTKEVSGDYSRISGEMGTTIPTMYNCLKKLAARGLVSQTSKSQYAISSDLSSVKVA